MTEMTLRSVTEFGETIAQGARYQNPTYAVLCRSLSGGLPEGIIMSLPSVHDR
jgi:hypothetical protein